MNMRSGNLFNIVAGTLLLAACAGCAQSRPHLKSETVADASSPAILQAVKAAPDGSELIVSANKPLTYTFYKTSDPPKMVIDLAQTDPGAVATPLEIKSATIDRVDVSKHGFGSGFLTRLDITLVKDQEVSVVPESGKERLLVKFAALPAVEGRRPAPPAEVSPAPAAPAAVQNVEPREKLAPSVDAPVAKAEAAPQVDGKSAGVDAGGRESKESAVAPTAAAPEPVKSPPAAEKVAEAAPAPVVEKPATAEKVLTALNTVQDGVELVIPGGVDKFTFFSISKPERLVIDLTGLKKATSPRLVAIDKFGISNARVGLTAETVRVVLDAAGSHLPSYQISKTGNGLKVNLQAPVASPSEPAAAEKPRLAAKAGGSHPHQVEAVEYKVVEGNSRITVKTGRACIPGKPEKHPQGWLLNVDDCQVPAHLQRPIDTSAFPGPVKAITPYQVRSKDKYSARILVKARSNATFNFRREDSGVIWDFRNPQAADAPAPLPETKKRPGVVETGTKAAEIPSGEQQVVVVSPGAKKGYTGRKVTLEFSDADVRKIFQLIAEVSNMNFLIADDVTGTISIKLVNVPWDQALDVILESKGLEMKREGNIVQIKPAGKFKSIEQGEAEAKKARERAMDLQTVVFDINYASVSEVVNQLNVLKTAREGVSISPDARTNRVIVTEIAPAIEKMKALLKTLDTPEKQVMIEARIVEATSSFTRDLGVQWGVHYADGAATNLFGISRLDTGFGGIVSPPPSSGTSGPGAAMGMSFGKLASNIQIDLRLSAAATNGQIKIISTPKVVTLNNKAAKISQGQSIPYQTTSAEGTKTEFVEAALTLEVTPHITADGNIGMKIKASNNSPGTGTPPPINKKEATTELQVKNGETTVIGGIYVDSDTEQDQGVPFLQDIPLLGWLFKSNTKTKTKTELLIFITPKIVL